MATRLIARSHSVADEVRQLYPSSVFCMVSLYGGLLKVIRGTFWKVPIIRITVIWGLYWVPLFLETTIY